MSVLGVAAVLAEWALAATCAAIAVAWLVKELLMGVCKIEKRLDGKVVIITGELHLSISRRELFITVFSLGGNTGIGYETALDLAERGAEVIIASRNKTTVSFNLFKQVDFAGQGETQNCWFGISFICCPGTKMPLIK